MRRPAYFSPARRRPPTSSHARPAMTRIASGGKRIDSTGRGQRRALAVDRQRALRVGVEPPAHAPEQRPRRVEAERRGGGAADDAGRYRVVVVGQRAGGRQALRARRRPPAAARRTRRCRGSRGGAARSRRAPPARARRAGTASDSRNAKLVPSKSSPTFADASAPARSTGRNGRMPMAAAIPAPWSRSSAKSTARATIAGGWAETRHRGARARGTSSATRGCSRGARRR